MEDSKKAIKTNVKDPDGFVRDSSFTAKMTKTDRKRLHSLSRKHAKTTADFLVLLVKNEDAVSKALSACI